MRLAITAMLFLTAGFAFAQESLYSISAENLPDVAIEQTVYLGDKMMEQRFGYYVQCLTPKQDLIFAQKTRERECLRSSQRFEKKCCLNGIRKIEEEGLLCPSGIKRGKYPVYEGENFYSFQRKDGTEKSKMQWTLRENKKKKRWYQEPASAKVVDLPKEEFDRIFTAEEIFRVDLVKMETGVKICKELAADYFQSEEGRKSLGSGSIRHKYASDVSEIPKTVSDGEPVSVTLVNNGNSPQITQLWNWNGLTVDPFLKDPVWIPKGGDSDLTLVSELTYEEAFDESRLYRIKNDLNQLSIEYAGRTGDILTFIYSEISSGIARDAFTREFRIDLSEGNVGAFKGAFFEVVEANNATITYKIVRHFPRG